MYGLQADYWNAFLFVYLFVCLFNLFLETWLGKITPPLLLHVMRIHVLRFRFLHYSLEGWRRYLYRTSRDEATAKVSGSP